MKTNAKYNRPWVGENANKLVINVTTAQHGTGTIAICADELVRLHKLFNDNFKYNQNGRRHDYDAMRTATA
jgi:hypothetical protein